MIDVGAIGQKHISKGAPILVEAVSLERHVLTKDQLRGRLLRSLPVGLAFLWTVDALESDTLRVLVVQDFDRVAVEARMTSRIDLPSFHSRKHSSFDLSPCAF